MVKSKKIFFFNLIELFILLVGIWIVGFCLKNKFYIGLLFLVLVILALILSKTKLHLVLLICSLWLVFGLLIIFNPYLQSIAKINILLAKTPFYSLRNMATSYISNIYNNNSTSSYINMLVFNLRDATNNNFYNNIKNLSIVHLFVVSGLHINLFGLILHKLFFWKVKNKRLISGFDLIFCLFYGYLLSFSISVIRIICNVLIRLIDPKINLEHVNYISALLVIFLLPGEISSYGYFMSYFCSIGVVHIYKNIKNKLILTVLINFYCILVTLPFVANMNHKINIFAFFYNYMYSTIVIFHYFWFILFGWWKPFIFINNYLFNSLNSLVLMNLDLSIYINLDFFNKNLQNLYWSFFLVFIGIFHIFYFKKKNIL